MEIQINDLLNELEQEYSRELSAKTRELVLERAARKALAARVEELEKALAAQGEPAPDAPAD